MEQSSDIEPLMTPNTENVTEFEQARPTLTGLAYRITGSYAEAEDVVQDVYFSWRTLDHSTISNPRSWLVTACTRKAIDSLRAARNSRTEYIGPWLPEPLQTDYLSGPDSSLLLSESVTTAFLVVMERLSPKERAAFILREVFEQDYCQVAESLGVSEAACRKLVSRAKTNVKDQPKKTQPPPERQDEIIAAFNAAVRTGDTGRLTELISDDIVLKADGGGKVIAVRRPLEGRTTVLKFTTKVLFRAWAEQSVRTVEFNASRALLIEKDDVPTALVTLAYDEFEKLCDIFIVRNPDKLAHVKAASEFQGRLLT
ncbi:MAG: RNA polymerase sigma factor SigJ [Proteobacteria bacterium]|nr:RNA polymerase sigma factor SigJ [Pseudomonadota bacterium]